MPSSKGALIHEELTGNVIGAAIEVHRELGPGLMESAHEECLCHELNLRGLRFQRQVPLPVQYKGIKLDCGYRIDLFVEETVYEAQLLTYLKMANKQVGLILNFYVPVLAQGGIVRRVL